MSHFFVGIAAASVAAASASACACAHARLAHPPTLPLPPAHASHTPQQTTTPQPHNPTTHKLNKPAKYHCHNHTYYYTFSNPQTPSLIGARSNSCIIMASSDTIPTTLSEKLHELKQAFDSRLVSKCEHDKTKKQILRNYAGDDGVQWSNTSDPIPVGTAAVGDCPDNYRWRIRCRLWWTTTLAIVILVLGIFVTANTQISRVWVYCPDSDIPNSCTPSCIRDIDNIVGWNKTTIVTCGCGQEFYDVSKEEFEWFNATNLEDRFSVEWDDVGEQPFKAFTRAATSTNLTTNSPVLEQAGHRVKVFKIYGYLILVVNIIIIITLWTMHRALRCSNNQTLSSDRMRRRAGRVVLLFVVLFIMSMVAWCNISHAMINNDSWDDLHNPKPSLASYYPHTCTLNVEHSYAPHLISITALSAIAGLGMAISFCRMARRDKCYHTKRNHVATAVEPSESVLLNPIANNQTEMVPPPYANQSKNPL